MSHNVKWILLVVGVLAFLVVGGIAAIFVLVRLTNTEESKREYEAKRVEGRELGKAMDQAGCMKEGLVRAKRMTRWEIKRGVANEVFVEDCLKTSRPTAGFCDGVPALWKLKDDEWTEDQCEKAGMDDMRTGCTSVFHAKLTVCRGH